MLVLSRKLGEKIIIGDNIEITISEIKGDQVKIAINAPKNIKIHRHEVFTAIQEENKKATQSLNLPKLEIDKKDSNPIL